MHLFLVFCWFYRSSFLHLAPLHAVSHLSFTSPSVYAPSSFFVLSPMFVLFTNIFHAGQHAYINIHLLMHRYTQENKRNMTLMSMANLPSLLQEAPLISDFPNNQATQVASSIYSPSGLLHFQSERAPKGPLATNLHLQDKLRVVLVANEDGRETLRVYVVRSAPCMLLISGQTRDQHAHAWPKTATTKRSGERRK